MSETPVTLPPGFSFEATSLATSKFVTAVATIGIVFVAAASVCAAGVAIAKRIFESFETKRAAMFCRFD